MGGSPAHETDEPALLSMTLADVLFAHWDVDPGVVAQTLPDRLAVDTYDGRAWLGVVAFVMADVRPRFSPVGRSFGQLNLRTYVRGADDTPGVYFYSLDADDRLGAALARWLFRLPYYPAEIDVRREGGDVRFRSRRTARDGPPARFDVAYRPTGTASAERTGSEASGGPFRPERGSLPFFLTERYRFYASGGDRLYYGDIGHEPWRLARAEADVRENTLFAAGGFDRPDGDPLCHYCRRLDATAGRVHRV